MNSVEKEFQSFDISVVIPACNDEYYLPLLLKSLNNQTFLPKEIIIVDSSSSNRTKLIVQEYKGTIPIHYQITDHAYPGHARNIGVKLAKTKWIAFIDCRTIPNYDWLEKSISIATKTKADFIGGLTVVESNNLFQQILCAATFGNEAFRTLPGSIVLKSCFEKSGGFIPNIRSAEDIEWINRIKSLGFKMEYEDEPFIRYYGLPNSLWTALKKYYKYAISTAQVDVLLNQKKLYLSIFLILFTVLVYKWNGIFANGDGKNALFIPHITKIYFASLVSLYVIFRGIIKPANLNNNLSLTEKTYLMILIVLTTGLIYKWNAIFAKWDIHSFFYIPHITKIYIISLLILSIIFRGIIRPLRRKVKISFLFPWRWLLVGFVGLCLDIVKAPGYVWGAFLELMGKSIRKSPLKS